MSAAADSTPAAPRRGLPPLAGDGAILVTGGTGTTGRLLLSWLLDEAQATRVIAFSRDEQKHYDLLQDPNFQQPALYSMVGDIRDPRRLREAMEGVSLVLHTAAMKHVPIAEAHPSEAIRTNVEGTENIIRAARDAGVARVIAHSTDKAVEPGCVYGATKLAMEKLLVAADFDSGADGPRFDILRHGNLIGSRGSVIPMFLEQKKSGRLKVTDPEMTRFWIGHDSLISAVHQVLIDGRGGEIFVPKSPSARLGTLARAIAPEAVIEVIGVRPGEKMHESLTSREESNRIRQFESHLVITPPSTGHQRRQDGSPVGPEFRLQSHHGPLLDLPAMKALLKSENLTSGHQTARFDIQSTNL
ncbi:MAG: polysaccharide biosynthesis protein [Planctomycetota bacterium]|nr:polysaccharide biosynthesis protein [Planctomycetota bacterium]